MHIAEKNNRSRQNKSATKIWENANMSFSNGDATLFTEMHALEQTLE
jgi:hypothetical protein